ncbi:hypothetical protein MTO96_030611 [Rhipicephalus appendiculatus]
MASLHVDVAWCTKDTKDTDRFLLVGTDIRLFQVPDTSSKETNRDVLPGAEPQAIQSDLLYFRCYSCYMNPRTDVLLAVGQDTGKVNLVSFGRTFHDQEWASREFVPKQPRRCNMVAWNPVNYNLLATCLDKHKGDHCIHVWDVQNAGSRPVELGYSDSAQSLSWFCQSPMTFVSGMNNKQLRIYDMRGQPISEPYCVSPNIRGTIVSFQSF